MKSFVLLLVSWLALLPLASAEERLALVIGNGDYEFSRKLVNPPRDAAAISAKLKAVGFEVTEGVNLGQEELETHFTEFSRKLKPSTTALVFFAGHGMQVNGVSYLLPVDAKVDESAKLKYEAVPLDMVLDLLDQDGKGAGLKIIMLDCCRNDPFGRGWRGSRDIANGEGMAAPSSTPKGTILCFATDPGNVAKDGSGVNSPYTTGLLEHLFTPNLHVDAALRRVGAAVQETTKGVQNPWRNSNFNGEFAFVSRAESTSPPLVMPRNPDPAPLRRDTSPRSATKESPSVNSLGMRFVPVPGTDVLFCIWETRVQDFAAFIQDSGYDYDAGDTPYTLDSDGWKQREGASWRNPGFTQGDDHPVTCVSWEDAQAFCEWLSKKEGMKYRLPTDHEWSVAVGIGDRENASASPKDKSSQIADVYPWGTSFPPPSDAGNYAGSEAQTSTWPSNSSVIDGYRDQHARTAPAGLYSANALGVFDLGGNVWEWCNDWYDPADPKSRVLRGGSWRNYISRNLLSSDRFFYTPTFRFDGYGFRCVLAVGSGG